MRTSFSKYKYSILLFITILFIGGCNANIEKSKSDLQNAYIRNIIGLNCEKAEESYNKMVKIDPTDQYPIITYIDQDLEKMDKQISKDISEGAKYAVSKSKELRQNGLFSNKKSQKELMYESIKPLNDAFDRMDEYMYQDKRPINYQQLKTYIDYCRVGNKQQIPIKDLKKSLDLKLKKELDKVR